MIIVLNVLFSVAAAAVAGVVVNTERYFYSFFCLSFCRTRVRACVSSKYFLDKYSLKAYKSMIMIHLSAFRLLSFSLSDALLCFFLLFLFFHLVAYNFIYFIPIFSPVLSVSLSLSFILFDFIFCCCHHSCRRYTFFRVDLFSPLIIPLE